MRLLTLPAVLLFAAVATHAPAQDKAGPEVIYASPKAVFDAAMKAEKKGDYKTFMGVYDPKSRRLVTGQLVAMSAMFKLYIASKEGAKFADKAPALDKLLAKHGIGREAIAKAVPGGKPGKMPNEKTLLELAKTVKEPGAFANEVIPFMEGLGLTKKGGDSGAELKNLEVEGNKATGVKVKQVDGKEVREPIEFVKVGRSWHLVAEKPKKADKDKK
jgi:hypothetical protein